jgi:hypothetical protein
MIDIGLLVSMAIMLTVPAVFIHPWPPGAVEAGVFDTALGPVVIGLAVGRLAALAIDDPGSLTNLGDVIIIRSGVEFWPGALAGLAWLAIRANRDGLSASVRLAALAPAGLTAWSCFEATCLLRDGCPGPVSAIGIRPEGLVTRMFPVGLGVAVAAAGGAFALDRLHRRGLRSLYVSIVAVMAVAAIRSVASIWLPHIGTGLTRQHATSIAVFILSVAAFLAVRVRRPSATPAVEVE